MTSKSAKAAVQPVEAVAVQPVEAVAVQPVEAVAVQPVEAAAVQPVEVAQEQPAKYVVKRFALLDQNADQVFADVREARKQAGDEASELLTRLDQLIDKLQVETVLVDLDKTPGAKSHEDENLAVAYCQLFNIGRREAQVRVKMMRAVQTHLHSMLTA